MGEILLIEAENEANKGLLASFSTKSSEISILFTRQPTRAKVSVALMIERLGLSKYLDEVFPEPKRNRAIAVLSYLEAIIFMQQQVQFLTRKILIERISISLYELDCIIGKYNGIKSRKR